MRGCFPPLILSPITFSTACIMPSAFYAPPPPGNRVVWGQPCKNNDIYIFITGSIWVYGTWSTVKSDTYVPCSHGNATEPGCTEGTCNNVLLTFAFATCTIDWILTGVWIVFISCMIMRACSSRVSFKS